VSIAWRWLRSLSSVRATKVASAPSARLIGLNGWSIAPIGDERVSCPLRDVGEYVVVAEGIERPGTLAWIPTLGF
jgi:hypothetical protein